MTNQELLKKADLALSDLSSGGGLMVPEQANSFIRTLIKQPTIINLIRTVEMVAPTRKIPKIKFGSRILRRATSATSLTEGQRAKPDLDQIELNTKEVIAEVRLPYDVIEDNVERGNIGAEQDGGGGARAGGGLVDTIRTLMAEAAARDLEELALRGDTTSTDDYLSMVDGFLTGLTADGNVVDNAGALPSRAMFKNGLQAIPAQFHRERASFRHFLSVNNEIEYREAIAQRETTLGDSTITTNPTVFGYGIPVVPVHLMPEDRGMLGHPQNYIFGIQRQMTMEYAKEITARTYIIVLTMRLDFQIEEPDANAVYTNVGQA